MARNTTATSRLLLLASAALLVSNAMADLTCYNTWGGEDPDQLPCFAPGTVNAGTTTWCCNKNDYCLSNGLCLSPESNNLMTQQGCTNKNWGGACTKFCPATKDQKPTAIPLIPCPASFDNTTNALKFCCGPDASTCCESTSSLSWLTLPPGTIMSSSTSTTTTSSSSSTSDPNSSYSLKIGLGIGLGIGLPILLVLCAVAYLLATPLRSRHRRRKNRSGSKQGSGSGSGGDSEKASSTTTTTTSPPHGTPHSSSDRDHKKKKRRRKSFGQVDTSVAPDSDDDDVAAAAAQHYHHHRWPPRGGGAAAVAAWARSPFGFGGMEGPAGAKEMDAGIGAGIGTAGRLQGVNKSAVELASEEVVEGDAGEVTRGAGRWTGRGGVVCRVAGEEVELPTPDTPASAVVGGLARREGEGDVEMGLGGGRRF